MRKNDSSKKTQSSIRYGMGVFMMLCISFNIYVMFLFNRKGAAGYINDSISSTEISTPQKIELNNDTDMLQASRERYKNRRLDTIKNTPQPQQQSKGRRRRQKDINNNQKNTKSNNINNNQKNTKSKEEEDTIKIDNDVNEGRIPWSRPNDWQKMTYFDVRKYFQCKQYAHKLNKPLPTEEVWQYFRKMYIAIVDKDAVFNDPIPPTQGYTLGRKGASPFYAGHGTRGRGLFASRDIRKGELIHDGTKSDISFPSGMAWRDYIFALPRKEACDMIGKLISLVHMMCSLSTEPSSPSWLWKKTGHGLKRINRMDGIISLQQLTYQFY